jgi:hypothetical protein
MRNSSKAAVVGIAAVGALLGGCATTVETGPGYYHYDTRAAGSPPAIVHETPAVVYRTPDVVDNQPAVVYRNPPMLYSQPAVVYGEPAVIYSEPTLMYRYPAANSAYSHDHGQ